MERPHHDAVEDLKRGTEVSGLSWSEAVDVKDAYQEATRRAAKIVLGEDGTHIVKPVREWWS